MASGGGGGAGGVSVPALWSEVNRYGQNGDFTRALKTVNKILQVNKDDVTALHCKVVCLIQNGSFKEALNIISSHTKVLANNSLSFEKAYCEYRLNRIENALKTIESANQQTDKLKELYGQVLYRLERYDECLAVYRDLVRNSQDDYDEERKTNLSAVVAAQSNWEKVVPENLGLQEGTHELCYNAACALIGQGQLSQAMKILQKAEDLCRRSLSEDSDGTEEDPQAELAIIHGQMAYILQLQGRTEEALQLYNQIIKLKPTDVGLLAVIANNIITINKAEQCRKISSSLQSQSPERLLPVLIQAAQFCREKQHVKAIELLQEFSDQHPENAAEIKLTMAQLKISQGNISKACLILRSIEELKHKPGMVSALVTMYSHEEDIDSAIEVFTQAIQWYQKHQPKSPAHLSLIREAANFKLKYGRKKEAISDLEQLWKQNPKDIHTLAQLISAYSLVDPEKAKALSKHLPSSDSMSLKVDVEALENSAGAMYVRKKGGKVAGESQPKEQGQGDLKKKKKKKKGKLPKNYDPKVTPDPERWLPMRERSYYRGRKKGKKKDQIGKGTQGATAGASSELDASKTVSSPPTSPRPGSAATASASTSNIIPPRHQKPAGAPATKKKQQQKKKKGGKGGW
ncbi:Signal recognition particle 72 kDa protein [Myotis davidii]|uniref:Signal recognition particle subunit SRP72 n=1 Tax=Myotis davidii TaxID=225400 RepID=L5M8Q3_MYODS|nr:Signal recognition particle 72 kDa protein [Myotis davidii]